MELDEILFQGYGGKILKALKKWAFLSEMGTFP